MKNETLTQVKAPYWYVNGSHHNGRSYSTKQKGLGTKCVWCAIHGDDKDATDHFIVGDYQVDLCNWCYNQAKSGLLHLEINAGIVWGSEVRTSSDKHTDYQFVTDNPDPAQRIGTCEFCGHKFPYEGKHKKFCSPQCSRWYHTKLDDNGDISTYRARPIREYRGVCELCGEEFVYQARQDYHRKTCSADCKTKLKAKKYKDNLVYIESTCLVCGKKFTTKVSLSGNYKRLCSDECRLERSRQKKREFSERLGRTDMEDLAKKLLGQP